MEIKSKKGKSADELLFRASSLGNIMTKSKSKSDPIGATAKTNLVDVFVSNVYERNTQIDTKFTNKGNQVEDDSITLLSRIEKSIFRKNETWLKNEFISGTPDLFIGKSIHEAEVIIDIKSSWDIFTFYRAITSKLKPIYYWQVQAYMALSGAKKARIVYCLVNTPEELIESEKQKAFYRLGQPQIDDDDLQLEFRRIEANSIYDDIPMDERIFSFEVERNDDDIKSAYEKIKLCRIWMNEVLFC